MEFPVDVPEWAGRKLKEASELTGETEDNLLRQAIKGDLPLWVWFPYPGADPKDVLFNKVRMLPYHGWAKIEPDAILRFINGEAISAFELRLFDRKKGILNCAAFYHPEVNTTSNKFHLSQIRVMPADLERLTLAVPKKQKPPIRKPGVKCRLTVALENARAILVGEKKKEPSPDDIINFLKLDDPTGAVVGSGKDKKGRYLEWVDKNGKYHTTHKKRIANKLSEIRKENGGIS